MNQHRALFIAFLLMASFWCVPISRAQNTDSTLETYVPPPMFGPADDKAAPSDVPDNQEPLPTPVQSVGPDSIVAFPVTTKTKDNSVNPSGPATATPTPSPAVNPALPPTPFVPGAVADGPPAPEKVPAPKPVRIVRKVPPVPPQRPAVLQASQAYLDEQKRVQDAEAAKKLADEDAAKKALEEKLAKEKADAEAKAKVEIAAEKPVPVKEEPPAIPAKIETPAPAVAETAPPPLPVAPPKPVDQTLMGQSLANPSVQQILENLENDRPVAPQTETPAGPADPFVRTVMIRPSDTTGPSVRIHAKRPPKKKETTHSFFILFDPNQTDITDLGRDNFDKKILPILNADPTLNMQILAYAKAGQKDEAEAQRISLARANSIRTYFMEKNIDADRLQIHALGAQASGTKQDRVDIFLQKEVVPGKAVAKTAPAASGSDLTTPIGPMMGPPVNKADQTPSGQ